MSDLDVEASKNFCDSLGESFGVGQDNHATLVSIVYFLLSIRLVDIVNEIDRVVIILILYMVTLLGLVRIQLDFNQSL